MRTNTAARTVTLTRRPGAAVLPLDIDHPLTFAGMDAAFAAALACGGTVEADTQEIAVCAPADRIEAGIAELRRCLATYEIELVNA